MNNRGYAYFGNTIEKIGPNRYRISTPHKKGQLKTSKRRADRDYCICGRMLRKNNRFGICTACREADRFSKETTKRCRRCGQLYEPTTNFQHCPACKKVLVQYNNEK